MAIQERRVEYNVAGIGFDAFVAWDDSSAAPRPGVLVSHAWGGRSEFEESKARWLASCGYLGFALDMYGMGVRGSSAEENTALMTPLLENRAELQSRISGALEVMRAQVEVDALQTAALGYCFGGLCVLDLARMGADVGGVVSLHGLFNPAGNTDGQKISAKVLCLHGYDDPMAPPESVLELAAELSAADADWQVHAYGGTLHAFTNPAAADRGMGTLYSAAADARSTQATTNFLQEVFVG